MYPTEYFRNNFIVENCSIEITDQCNFKCIHCDYPKKRNGHFMSLSDLDMIIPQLMKLGTFRITITGGEPFEHPEITNIVSKLIESNFFVKIITNGFNITEKHIDELKKFNKLEIIFSLLGTEHVHDSITNINGSFDKIISNISKFKMMKCKVSTQTCVLKNNIQNLKQLTSYLDKLGVDGKFDPYVTNNMLGDNIIKLRLSDDELVAYYRDYTELKGFVNKVEKEPDIVRLKSCDCGVARSTISIGANGNVYPCANIRVTVGNIHESTLEDIWWNSDFINELRIRDDDDRTKCAYCDMNTLCSRCVAMSITEHNDWRHSPEECCRHMKCLKEAALC